MGGQKEMAAPVDKVAFLTHRIVNRQRLAAISSCPHSFLLSICRNRHRMPILLLRTEPRALPHPSVHSENTDTSRPWMSYTRIHLQSTSWIVLTGACHRSIDPPATKPANGIPTPPPRPLATCCGTVFGSPGSRALGSENRHISDDVATCVDSKGACVTCSWIVDCSEALFIPQKTVPLVVRASVGSHDLAGGTDVPGRGEYAAGNVKGREDAVLDQVAMPLPPIGGSV